MPEPIDEKKLQAYKTALAEVIAELTKKRADLALLASTTIERLEPSIVELRHVEKQLKAQVEQLNAEIASKKAESERIKTNWDNHYNELEGTLRNIYSVKSEQVDAIQRACSKAYDDKLSNLTIREIALNNNRIRIDGIEQGLAVRIKDFDSKEMQSFKHNEAIRVELTKKLETARVDAAVIEAKNKEVSDKIALLDIEITKAKAVTAKIDEANELLRLATDKETANLEFDRKNKERQAELNQFNVKVRADMIRCSKRTDELDDRERKLNERENNLKILEAKV